MPLPPASATDALDLCAADAIPEGEGRPFSVTLPGGEPLEVVVVRYQGALRAFENRCAHFGVRLDVTAGYPFIDRDTIRCQVHYARYDPDSGACLRGDCDGQGLRPLTLIERNGRLHLHP